MPKNTVLTISIIKDDVQTKIIDFNFRHYDKNETYDLHTHKIVRGEHVYTKVGEKNWRESFNEIWLDGLVESWANLLNETRSPEKSLAVFIEFSGYEDDPESDWNTLITLPSKSNNILPHIVDDIELLFKKVEDLKETK